MNAEPTVIVDARNTFCPIPIIRMAAQIKKVEVGEVVRVLATDFGLYPDLEAWSKGTKHEVVSISDDGKVITADIRRAL